MNWLISLIMPWPFRRETKRERLDRLERESQQVDAESRALMNEITALRQKDWPKNA